MLGAEQPAPEGDLEEELFVLPPLVGTGALKPQRPSGEVYESPMLGRMEFFGMPQGRPSFWRGEQWMPDCRWPLQIVCEVAGDDLPGSDQMACVTAFRRLQVQDAMVCAPLINARLKELQIAVAVAVDDLVMTLIHLPPRPLVDARFELGFRATSIPPLSFTVVFVRGAPRAVRIDSDI
jgi:hypothetical protein